MKKIITYATLASILLASCAQKAELELNPNSELSPITFGTPFVSPKSVIEGTTYPTTSEFKVYAKLTNAAYSTWSAGSDFFTATGETVAYQANVKESRYAWTPVSKNYYWPKAESAKLHFAAYSPADATKATIDMNGVKFGTSADCYLATTTANGQDDLLYSERVVGQKKNVDVDADMYGVRIPFYHALSQIAIKSQISSATTLNTGESVKITSVKLEKMNTSAYFTQDLADNTGAGVAAGAGAGWTMNSTPNLNEYANVVKDTSAELGTLSGDNYYPFLVIPQALLTGTDSDAQKIVIEYTTNINSVTENLTATVALSSLNYMNGSTETPLSKLEMGKKYIITITFELEKIYFAPVVAADWTVVDLIGGITI